MSDHYHYIAVYFYKWNNQEHYLFHFVLGERHSLEAIREAVEEDAEQPVTWLSNGFWDGKQESAPVKEDSIVGKYVIQRTYNHDCPFEEEEKEQYLFSGAGATYLIRFFHFLKEKFKRKKAG